VVSPREPCTRKPTTPALGGSWGVLRQKVKKGKGKGTGKGKANKKKSMAERGYESAAAERSRAAKEASDKEAAAAAVASERKKRRPHRPVDRKEKEKEDPLRIEKMKAVAREAIGKRIAIVRPLPRGVCVSSLAAPHAQGDCTTRAKRWSRRHLAPPAPSEERKPWTRGDVCCVFAGGGGERVLSGGALESVGRGGGAC
jgi:hypothetical protein